MKSVKWIALGLAVFLTLPALADTGKGPPVPGTLNYVEGQVSTGAQTLSSKSVGTMELEPGQSLITATGKTEMLLTPGVFLRLGDHSSAQMVSSSLTNTQVAINQGEALVEVDEVHPQNDLRITEDGVRTRLIKTGLYDFDADHALVRVVDGKAVVSNNDHNVTVKGGHELALNHTGPLKARKFDKKTFEATDLYRWSSLRSDYLAEANVDAASRYFVGGWYGPGWFGPGWYWDPWFTAYTFIPGDGIFYNPFGWGFYSPLWAYTAPFYYGGGYGNRPVRIAPAPARYHNQAIHSSALAARGGGRSFGAFSAGGGFHSGFAGGGFHGGFGGGFVGGGVVRR
jgi:hypothetical protein